MENTLAYYTTDSIIFEKSFKVQNSEDEAGWRWDSSARLGWFQCFWGGLLGLPTNVALTL